MEIPEADLTTARAVLIAGPTGSGKSALALAVANRAKALGRDPLVVNADSMQVYSGLRILTARPGPRELARATHALYGHVPPGQGYSVGRWLDDVKAVLGDKRGERAPGGGSPRSARPAALPLPIFAGGTGLYLEALTTGLADIPPVPQSVRAVWRERMKVEGPERLHACLAARHPPTAALIRSGDRQRIVRALEVLEATGRPLTAWHDRGAAPLVNPQEAARLVLSPTRERLYALIGRRLDAMVEQGVLKEVEMLLALRLDPDLPAMKAIGVREFAGVLEKKVALAEAVAQAKTRTRRYAKRQLTWLRHRMADWTWVEGPLVDDKP